jgi:gliding motility-associated-like protein
VQILEPDSLYAIMHVRPVRCHGDNDGALNAATFGGSGVYTWEWYKDGALFATTEDLDSITSGVYTLILQDSEGCIFTDSWLVPEPDVMEITGTVKHSSCAGANNGIIEPVITGGAPPYTFLWNTGQTTRIIPNLAPTNLEPYEIMVKDTNNCVVYMQFTVNEPTGTPALTYDKVIYCVNEPNPTPTLENVWNGEFVATGTGLDIDPSTGEINLSNSSLGTYTVNYVSDIAMCNTASFEVAIKAEESPAFTFPTRFCKQNGGTFTPQIQGTPDGRFSGTALPDSLTGEVAIDSLAAGPYTLIYTTPDCHEVKTLEFEIYDEPTANIFQSDTVVCEGTAINLQAEASVGTYLWEINSQVMGDQQTLSHSFDTPGSYRVKLTSETGDGFCTKTEQITVRVSEYPTVDLGADIFSCEAPVTLDAGNAGMTYLWSSGETSQTLTVTESGTYSVIVTNADGCATTSTEINVTITKPKIAVFKENISCLGENDGSIQIEVTEGTPPYRIRWNDRATDSVLFREHLAAGTYVLTVEDSKGCISTVEVEIVEPEAITATAEIRKPTCFEAGNGFIILDIQGGTIAPGSDYTVNWSNGMTGKRIDGLSNGIYEAEISDDNGCLGYWRGTIDEVDSMRIELVLTNASCEGATDGSAVFNISGGQSPYTVTYSKPNFSGLANRNLAPTGDVPIHAWVEDASGHCRQEFTFEIGVAPTSILDFNVQDTAVCVGETTQLNFRYTGEIYPYRIVFEDNGQEVQLEGADSTLTHEVTITEDREFVLKAVRYGSGCEGIASGEAKVTAKPLPELANPLISHANCGNEDGQIAIDTEEIEAGSAPFEFSLDGENFTTDTLFTDLEPGEYTLYIREADGCVFVFPAPILIQDKACSVKNIPTVIIPNGDGKNDAWIVDDLRAYPQCIVRIYSRDGHLVHESEPGYTSPWDASGHPFGTYFYTIDLRNGEIVQGFITVVR